MDAGNAELVVEAGVGYGDSGWRVTVEEIGRWVSGVGGGSEGVKELESAGAAGDVVH